MTRRARNPRIAVVFGYLLVAVAFTWPLPLQMGSALTGDPGGDTGVYIWNQWVFQHEAVVERHNPLTTEQVLSLTQRVDLSQHNYTAFLNLIALPLIPWLGIVATFNVVFLMMTVLTALATYTLVRRVTATTRLEAWLAGLLFAWSPVLIARGTGHYSLVAAAPLPAFLLCLLNAERSRTFRSAALVGLCVAWAAFCDVYYAVYCLMIGGGYLVLRVVHVTRKTAPAPRTWRWILDVLIVLLLGLVAGLLFGRGGRFDLFGLHVSIRGLYTPVLVLTLVVVARALVALRPRVSLDDWVPSPVGARTLVVAGLACAGPLSPILYGLGQEVLHGGYANPPVFWRSSPRGVDLLALFAFNPSHPLARRFHDAQTANATTFVDYTAALSLVGILVVCVAVWRAGFRPRTGWLWLAGGFATLSLGPFLYVGGVNTLVPLPWAILRYMPIVGAARSPARFAVVAALGLAVLFAGALAALGHRYPHRRRAIAVIAGVLVLFELFPAPRILYSAEVPRSIERLRQIHAPVRIVELPIGVRDGVSGVGNFSSRYLLHQTVHGKKLIGGYLSRIPKSGSTRCARNRRLMP